MPTVHVHFLPMLAPASALRGGTVVIIDLLRASTTIVRALESGARAVHPCVEPDEARRRCDDLLADGRPAESVVLGGERGGVRIPGFDLGNSPCEYTPEAVGGREVVFTTTNGTRALHAARDGGAASVLIGCLNNLAATFGRCEELSRVSSRPVHLVCAGTNGEISLDDVVCAGAVTDGLLARGFTHGNDDPSRMARALWTHTRATAAGGVLEALRSSRGGRNLLRLGMDGDIAECASIDISGRVPELGPDGTLTG